MIQFEPLISWTWAWLFALAIVVILAFQLFWIVKTDLPRSRKAIKSALNVLFGLLLIAYVFQPYWSSDSAEEAVLVYSPAYSKDEIRIWKDSLKVKNVVELSKFQGDGNPVFLLGSDFSQTELLKIGNKEILWINDFESGSISFLEWKGILREGEMQHVNGRIAAKDSLKISLSQVGEILAEAVTDPNESTFNLEFPAKVLGRNEIKLLVNDSLVGSVNFFVHASKSIQYSLQFSFPDAEIRNLTQYLINSGEQVCEQIGISKNAVIRSGDAESDSLQFLIIDPAQLSKRSTQEAIEKGASVLVMNGSDASNDVAAINKAFGTNFSINRISSEESRAIEGDLEASPFEFEAQLAQKRLFENSVAIQNIGNSKIGLSLLGKTFPLKLSGDSVRFQAVWEKILGELKPQESSAVSMTQPVFEGLQTLIEANQVEFEKDFIRVESDSVFLQQSLVNPFSKYGSFISLDSGWISVGDSLEFYSYSGDEWASLKAAKLRADFLKMHSNLGSVEKGYISQKKVSAWIWFGMFLLILILIWLEPKLLK
ncbi:hypothetical protein SAMN04489724_2629 [Algoriphagus locisalis]|uniref:Uncharacterized protein n=1 Tax=Algoriphagus locisalis TaxID=305507 RepID=A0A1I7BR46_9BACT|nr:hypothetical protein [Algoriphagus locisalis]SFT89664.1 hypothetical protein SAMN04489724_2629 [Algoriphagus locisalis]